jgi:hypothetical protein
LQELTALQAIFHVLLDPLLRIVFQLAESERDKFVVAGMQLTFACHIFLWTWFVSSGRESKCIGDQFLSAKCEELYWHHLSPPTSLALRVVIP